MNRNSEIEFFQIDAFAEGPFEGNPAAVCLMNREADDSWLQSVAAEMNLSETAFVWKRPEGLQLRWFTPVAEVDLCGHATLAASFALWQSGWLAPDAEARFQTRSGWLTARAEGGQIWLDFPAQPPKETNNGGSTVDALGVQAVWAGSNGVDFIIEVETESEVLNAQPDFASLKRVDGRGVMLTSVASRSEYDFISRFFVPKLGIDEDPVTGSAHVCLAPYWAAKLGRTKLTGFQASSRGGIVQTEIVDDRVRLGGKAVVIVRGHLLV